jgi:DNA-binding HxlR family transcriptional regulator
MRWRDIGDERCSIARTLSVIGDRWTMLVLRETFLRTRRFEDFQSHIGATRHVLADRLQKLVEHGILARVQYQDRPPRFEYKLTEKGRDLYPVITSLLGWGDRWMADEDGPPIELVHRNCGHRMVPVPSCPHCGEHHARDVTAQPGAAAAARGGRRD